MSVGGTQRTAGGAGAGLQRLMGERGEPAQKSQEPMEASISVKLFVVECGVGLCDGGKDSRLRCLLSAFCFPHEKSLGRRPIRPWPHYSGNEHDPINVSRAMYMKLAASLSDPQFCFRRLLEQ
jgi:hypothetical protein